MAIVVGAYSVGRGLAKSGVREYPEDAGGDRSRSGGSSGSRGSGGGGSNDDDEDDS